ncbi:NYN domain-containing protein, partial [bacterium]|nr:NYN domain-containing protein [bacterium]
MTKLSKYQKVGVFVDVQNMFYSARHQYRAKLNFTKLLESAVKGRRLIRAIAYIVQTEGIDQKNFIDMLSRTGYEVKSKDLKIRPDGTRKGDWDMGIAIDSISLADRIDAMILVSGDG